MKRCVSIVLAGLLLLTLCGCSSQNTQLKVPVTYYYRTPEPNYGPGASIITTEPREAAGHTDDYRFLLEQYLSGPQTNACISPFPAGISLEELNIESNKVQIILSPHLAVLSGAELMVACACLYKTIVGMTGIDTVEIRAEHSLLNGKESITLNDYNFSYWDTDPPVSP